MPKFSFAPVDEYLDDEGYDGHYIDEDGNLHHTWKTFSETEDHMYMIDYNEVTREFFCTCKAGEFNKQCKHIKLLSLLPITQTSAPLV